MFGQSSDNLLGQSTDKNVRQIYKQQYRPIYRQQCWANLQTTMLGKSADNIVFIFIYTNLAKNNKIITKVRHYINKII